MIKPPENESIVIEKEIISDVIFKLIKATDNPRLENALTNADSYFSIFSESVVWKTSSPLRKIFSIRKETAVILLSVASGLLSNLTDYSIPAACLLFSAAVVHLLWGEDDED